MHSNSEKINLITRVIKTDLVNWKDFKFIQQDDFKSWTPEAKQKLKNSVLQNQFTQPFYVWQEKSSGDIYCLDGKHRTLILDELEKEQHNIPILLDATFIECKDINEAASLVLVYSSMYAKVSQQGLLDFMKVYELSTDQFNDTIDLPGFDQDEFDKLLNPNLSNIVLNNPTLQEKFIIPPFSIFDTRQGYWQDRKRAWHSLFNSQETREDVDLISKSGQAPAIYKLRNDMREHLKREPEWDEIIAEAKKKGMHVYEGASVFDPVLAEICYTWFCPPGGNIFDPFAGGSVRGIVAAMLGHFYYGIDLRKEQVVANIHQVEELQLGKDKTRPLPHWFVGDSMNMDKLLPKKILYDFIFSCPPYHDLEKYSNDPADLSNMTYKQFIVVYQAIIMQALQKLKPDRFACFVVGDIRDEKGFYRNFLQDTIDAFQHSGECKLYNEIILVNVAGSLPIRIGRQFGRFRKVGKMHQNVLVFYKGDIKKIPENFPEIEVADLPVDEMACVEKL